MTMSPRAAIVAGATRGAGRTIAIELGRLGLIVYCTGRTHSAGGSDQRRPETIAETAELVTRAGGRGISVVVDHADVDQVHELAARIRRETGGLDVLVNALWGGERFIEWDTPLWERDLANGFRLLDSALGTHLITAHELLPLMINREAPLLVEITDGTETYNRVNYRSDAFYDLAKTALQRLAFGIDIELRPFGGSAVAITPGWMRTEWMLDQFGVTEATWRDGCRVDPHFAITETPWFVARAVAAVVNDDERAQWGGRSVSAFDLAQAYGFSDIDGSRPDCWRYNSEVKDRGLPARVEGYR